MSILTRTQTMGIAALALGVSVFLSRVLGLVRDKVISYYFGAGVEADVYFTAFVAPDFLNYLLAGGYFSITLVPLLAAAFAKDEEEGWRLFSAAVCWAALGISVLTAVAWFFTPSIARWIAPGFSPAAQERLMLFLRIILPAQMCFLPGACFSAMLYLRRQFTVPALTPLVYNGCIILGGILSAWLFPERGMEGFCWGVLAGAFLGSFVLPVWAVRSGGLRFSCRLAHSGIKALWLLALPLMLGQSIVALDEQFVRIFGSLTGEGGVSLLSYARRIMLVPVGVVAQAAGLASYPFLASLAARGDKKGFNENLNRAATSTLLVALPLSLCMMVAAEPVMRLIFQQGGFTADDASRSGLLLAVMLAGVAFWSVQQIVGRAFYAHRDTLTPALVGSACTAAALPVYWLGASRLGPVGVALAGVFGVVLYTLALCQVWKRRFGPEALSGLAACAASSLMCCAPACAAAYAVLWTTGSLFAPASLWGAAVKIFAVGVTFGLVYLALVVAFAPAAAAPLREFAAKALRRLNKG